MVAMTSIENIYNMPNLGCLLGIAYQAELGRLSKALEEAGIGITAPEYLIMRLLKGQQSVQQCEIARILGKDKASISRNISSLVKKGLVRVETVSYKCSMVALTREGKTLEPRILKIASDLQQRLDSRLTPPQMDSLREILKAIID